VGTLNLETRKLDPNKRAISPNDTLTTPDPETLKILFSGEDFSYIPIGKIDNYMGKTSQNDVWIALKGDEVISKHLSIFGMTGSGKTNTASVILEELMPRFHRTVVFDPHDDYMRIFDYQHLFKKTDGNPECPNLSTCSVVSHIHKSNNSLKREKICHQVLRLSSVFLNQDISSFFISGCQQKISTQFLDEIENEVPKIFTTPLVEQLEFFPEVAYYPDMGIDYTISMIEAMIEEDFTDAQRRMLYDYIGDNSLTGLQGVNYLNRLSDRMPTGSADPYRTGATIRAKITQARGTYERGTKIVNAKRIDGLAQEICLKNNHDLPCMFVISLSKLSDNIRKLCVFAVVRYIFRKYKNIVPQGGGEISPWTPEKRRPIFFVFEEARSLIPKSRGQFDRTSDKVARSAARELAYEARGFGIGYCVVSQKPSSVDDEVVSQTNTYIIHQLKSEDDRNFVRLVTEGLEREDLALVGSLGPGRAILTGSAIKSPVLVNIRERYSIEGKPEPRHLSNRVNGSCRPYYNIKEKLQKNV
jgi:hypothetical protein